MTRTRRSPSGPHAITSTASVPSAVSSRSPSRARFAGRASTRQPAPVLEPAATRTVVAPWRRSLLIDTTGWPEGYYVLKLETGSGAQTQVPYIVSSRSAEGTVALVAPVTTWQAYNAWGGYSLYEGPDGTARSWAVPSRSRSSRSATGVTSSRSRPRRALG